ncbi:MAG TPA: DUF192 domain-containing protein [Gammaproteobacteria bacterium]|nr:DUF192 domain-containing protein [Gammaproteobacteria bacterium]
MAESLLMTLRARIILVAFLTVGVVLGNRLFSRQQTPEEHGLAIWRGMDQAILVVDNGHGKTRRLEVRVADDSAERGQGMQYLPADTIRANPIWFVFPDERTAGWHMSNVSLALDIAFVGAGGRVIAVQRMEPGHGGYGIDRPIRYALEVAAGRADDLHIHPGTRLRLAGD